MTQLLVCCIVGVACAYCSCSVVKDENPSAEAVALCATETMRSLDRLSQPTQLKGNPQEVWCISGRQYCCWPPISVRYGRPEMV